MGLLDGKVAIVTGAGHGVGRGHALELAKHGATVVVNDLGGSVHGDRGDNDRAADKTVALVTERGGTAIPNYDDVGDHDACERMVQSAVTEFGRLDIVINNAGIVRDAAIWNMSEGDFDAVIRVHLKGTWSMCHHAAKHFRAVAKERGDARGGRIINTTSGAGLGGNFGQSNYATAKAGVVGLSLTLAQELARIGVTVNVIGPSGLTRITATMPGMGESFEPDEIPDDSFHPMDPANASPVVAWLASDEAQHVTGQVIRAIGDRIIWMQGWKERAVVTSGEKKWDAAQLGDILARDMFETRHPGMRF